MRGSFDNRSSANATGTARSSMNNLAALTEAVNVVTNYESLPSSTGNLEAMGGVSTVTSSTNAITNTIATTATGDPPLTDMTDDNPIEDMETTVPFNMPKLKRKASVYGGAAGVLGVSVHELEYKDNKDYIPTIDTDNNNQTRRKSSLTGISNTVLDLLGVGGGGGGGRVVPVDNPPIVTTPPHTSNTPSHTSARLIEDEKKDATGRS